jgi:hypothetical protein
MWPMVSSDINAKRMYCCKPVMPFQRVKKPLSLIDMTGHAGMSRTTSVSVPELIS